MSAIWTPGQTSLYPTLGQKVTYYLNGDQIVQHGVVSVPATVTGLHGPGAPTCVDLQWTLNGTTFTELTVTQGTSRGNWNWS